MCDVCDVCVYPGAVRCHTGVFCTFCLQCTTVSCHLSRISFLRVLVRNWFSPSLLASNARIRLLCTYRIVTIPQSAIRLHWE